VPAPNAESERKLARRFAAAFTEGDVDGVVALLTDDAWLAMPPAPHEYFGQRAIAAFLRASAEWRTGSRFELLPTRANLQSAFGCYVHEAGTAHPAGIIVLSLRGGAVRTITRFLDGRLNSKFNLPGGAPAILTAEAHGHGDIDSAASGRSRTRHADPQPGDA
jgi:RNA polymerase sigma-70 factor (ECF subfamily)